MRATARNSMNGCRPRCGLAIVYYDCPRVSLAKPRSTLGFMLTRASRVESVKLQLRQRLRLAVDEVVHHYDVVFLVIVWTRRRVAGGYAHRCDSRIVEFDPEE